MDRLDEDPEAMAKVIVGSGVLLTYIIIVLVWYWALVGGEPEWAKLLLHPATFYVLNKWLWRLNHMGSEYVLKDG